jgi:hypothetical protein
MRYRFFLDARDYVKYALLDDLMAQFDLRQLTLIWMLTPDVGNTHGSRRPKFDEERALLNAFFQRSPRPDLWEVQQYFEQRGYACSSVGDREDAYITRETRAGYFDAIDDELLGDAVVFIDPDNGVEPRSGASTFHVRLEELQIIWDRMNDRSLLVIYQHKPRVAGDVFWPDVSTRVCEALGEDVNALTFGDVGFLVAGRRDVREVLRREGHGLHI